MKFLFTICITLLSLTSFSQELNCTVKVNADQVQTSNRRIFESLEQAMSEFMSTRKWTKMEVQPNERIDCSILFTIDKDGFTSNQNFKGTMQVQSTRPVYKSAYSTNMLKTNDRDISFTYRENTPVEFVPDQYRNELSSILGYYAYVIIGLDFESFGPNGGEEQLSNAMGTMNLAQNGGGSGWSAFDSRTNRYWLISEALENSYSAYREALYLYHRQGLDLMVSDQETAQLNILTALQNLEKVHMAKPLLFINQLFFQAKREELVELFKLGEMENRKEMVRICKKLDPSNSSKFEEVLK
ncbi:MAG: hypothetical protein ACI9YL_000315 [Luteibaculaceae bacterium]|jgi:hypothetical protein